MLAALVRANDPAALGDAGYVALFEIDAARTVSIVAIRHQREDDYH